MLGTRREVVILSGIDLVVVQFNRNDFRGLLAVHPLRESITVRLHGVAHDLAARPSMGAPGGVLLAACAIIPVERRAGQERPARWISNGGIVG